MDVADARRATVPGRRAPGVRPFRGSDDIGKALIDMNREFDTVIGIDAHKRTHTLVAVNNVGRKLGEKTGPTTTEGHATAMMWVRSKYGRDVLWAVEDCRSLTARLERDLLGAGQKVVRVPPHLMSRARASARTPGKSDPIDAMSVARAVLREGSLPIASHDEQSWTLKQLVDRREDLVGQRRATINRILWRIHELDPEQQKPKNWQHKRTRQRIGDWLSTQPGLTAELARSELDDINRLTEDMDELADRIRVIVAVSAAHLMSTPGCGELTAAKILAETAGVERFKSEAAFARYIGVAPIPHSSGTVVVRQIPMRRGNRQLNAAVHRIAVTQIRLQDCPGRIFHQRRLEEGDTRGQALRALKRRLSRVVYQALRADRGLRQAQVA